MCAPCAGEDGEIRMTETEVEYETATPADDGLKHLLCVVCNGDINLGQVRRRELVRTLCGVDVPGSLMADLFDRSWHGFPMPESCVPCADRYDERGSKCDEHKDVPLGEGVW